MPTKLEPARLTYLFGWRHALWLPLLAAAAALSLATGGRHDVDLSHLWGALCFPDQSSQQAIMLDLRLPRALVAAFLGSNLALAGLALQAVTRNPLASPGILGINQGAALGLTFGLIVPGVPLLTATLAGALMTTLLTFSLAGRQRDSLRLILAGVAVGALAYAMVRFAFTLEDDLARTVVRWAVGDIAKVRWPQAIWLAICGLFGGFFSLVLAHRFDLLALGQTTAQGLGSNPQKTLILGAVLAALLTGVCVSVAGPIAFAGLVVPHLARYLVGNSHRVLVPTSAVLGAGLLLLSDGLSKLIMASEAPVGVVLGMLGAPLFLVLVIRHKERLC